jgi:hypothetical protein
MNEIYSHKSLRIYGCFLAFTHLLTAYFWLDMYWGHIPHFTDAFPICWPHLQGCEAWGRLSPRGLFAIISVYSGLAGLAGWLFIYKPRAGFWLLALVSLMKFGLFQLDYRLAGNYHYMHFWVLAAYFLIPQRALTIRFLLMGFYLGAGILKLNKEWLTGAAIWENPYLSGTVLKAGCWYVAALELVLVFGLLSKRRWIFWATLGQLFLFHAVSYLIVSYYYPLMLMSLLSIFILAKGEELNFADLRLPSRLFLALFAFAQILPFLLGGDRAVDGRGRLVALNMFDASTQCEFEAIAHFKNGEVKLPRLYQLEERLKCDPHVLLTEAQWRCRRLMAMPGFESLNVSLKSKRKTDPEFRRIFSFENFCREPHHMNFWGWIR